MSPESWGVVIAVLGVVSIITAIYYLIRDNFKQASKINKLEYEQDKHKAREDAKKDDLDTVADRIWKHLKRK